MSTPRLYLLDASNYLFRAFHATSARMGFESSLSTSAGMPTNAILVFTNMVRKLVREHAPTHFACVFDAPGANNTRKVKYAEYKANRAQMPPDLVPQMPYFRPLATALGLTILERPGLEADDLIATLALRAHKMGADAVIVSSDKDLYQLIGTGVRVFDAMKDKWIDHDACFDKFGVGPDKVVEVQGLIGDDVDNIPGIDGIGPKTAAKLITEYGSLEGIYEHLGDIKGKLQERLETGRENAFLSRDLARLVIDAPIDLSLDGLAVQAPNVADLLRMFTELEFRTLIREFQPVSAPVAEATRRLVQSTEDLAALVQALEASPQFAVDGLGDQTPYSRAGIVGLGFATSPTESWYVPLRHRRIDGGTQLTTAEVFPALAPFFGAEYEPRRVAHAWKELAFVLAREGIPVSGVAFDTELGSYLANATKYAHTLENIALDRLEMKLPTVPNEIERGRDGWDNAPLDVARDVVLARAEAVLRLVEPISKELDLAGGTSLLKDLEQPLSRVLLGMELDGVRIDPDVLRGLSGRFGELMTKTERACWTLAGVEFNLGSPKQLGEVLFEKMGLPVLKKTKTGASTDASVLEQLAEEHPIVQTILDWRELSKLKGTYTDVLPTLIDSRTHRIHTSFRQAIAATGRLSSFDPNLQNIPIRSEEGRRIRDAFIPRDGHALMSADYSQVELRLLAHLCQDPGLLRAFSDRVDVHRRTASEVLGVAEPDVTKDQRNAAKAINFGLMYGMGAFRLARDLQISRKQAQEYIDRYFERYSAVKAFMDGTIERGRADGYVSTLLGRRRYVPDLKAKDHVRRSAAERAAINTPVQGTAADIIKLAMLEVARVLNDEDFKGRMVLQVHDELVFDVPEDEAERLAPRIQSAMSSVVSLSVPLDVEVGWGKTWNAAH